MTGTLVVDQELKTAGEGLAGQAKALRVGDEPTFQRAGVMLRAVKDYLARVGEVLNPIIQAAHKAHAEALAQKKKLEGPALEAERVLKTSMGTYQVEQERLARAAEAAAEVVRARLEDEAKLQAALDAEARGDGQGAERILEAATPPAPIIVPAAVSPPPPKAEGVSFRTNHRAEVVDLMALVKAVAKGEAALAYLEPNLPALNQAARALKEELKVPGVRVIAERIAAVRA